MKVFIGFVIGLATSFICFTCLSLLVPVNAEEDNLKGIKDLMSFVQSIGEINRQALITPLNEAAKTITDPSIATYYNTLLKKCDLLEEPENSQN